MMIEDVLVVSCDIVGHSSEPDVAVQVERARALNDVVRDVLPAADGKGAAWFSAGDGGYVAFASAGGAQALGLMRALKVWSLESAVPLRIAACAGAAARFRGADGRVDMIGPALTLAARLLQHVASDAGIVVSDRFRSQCEAALPQGATFHDPRTVRGPFDDVQRVWLFSVAGAFTSRWNGAAAAAPQLPDRDDRRELQAAVTHRDGLAVLYWAKRLLQVNAADEDAVRAVRGLMGAEASRVTSSGVLAQLFVDPALGQEFVRAGVLVERGGGEILCRAGDEGQTMFLIVRGRVAGFLPSAAERQRTAPDFELGAGDLVGEMAFALKAPRTATLVCTDDTALLGFSQKELFAAANASPLLPRIRQTVDAIVRSRVVQNVCKTAPYLSGPTRSGPLGRIERPWVDLDPYCRTIHVGWQDGELRFDAPAFREPGLYVLAAGKLESADSGVLEAEAAPIVAADVPGGVAYRRPPCRVLDDVTILFISSAGLEHFGPAVHRQLLAEITARTGRAKARRPAGSDVEGLVRITGDDGGVRAVDVVFVHGLDGDARTTWHPKDDPDRFWPSWLGDDVAGAAVWSLGYAVSSSAWRGAAMPLADRATNALAMLETQGFGDRPIVFICHSLGGLLVKQMLRHALDFGVPAWKTIAEQTRGIVFLSTPHSGSDISTWMKHLGTILRLTVSVDELQAHDPRLRELNTWFRNCPILPNIRIQVYCEKQTVGGLLVVNESSADPGLAGVVPIPLDENHVSICKPDTRAKLVYSRVKRFVEEVALATT